MRPQRTTLDAYVEDWLPVLRSQVRSSTASSYERNLRLHVLPALGTKPLQSIRPADLTTLYGRLLQSGRLDHQRRPVGGLSPRSVAYVATIVGKVLEAAVRGELIASNPARRAEVPKATSKTGRSATMHTWTREQLGSFLEAGRGHRHHPAWLLLATTGLRRGEALGLQWADLDLDARRLTVRRSLVDVERGEACVHEVKQGRGRSMALDPGTVAALRILRAEQLQERLLVGPGYVDGDLMFATPDGRPYHPDRFARVFVERAKVLGLPAIRVHDLRHTWATLALGAGVHPKVVQERLGHSSISVTLDIYSHVVPAMETDAADRVAALILGSNA